MLKIVGSDLLRAFGHAGWLDSETGEIIFCNTKMQPNGENKFALNQRMIENQERFTRIPYLDSVQIALDYVNEGRVPAPLLERYGIEKLNYSNPSCLLYTPYDGLRDGDTKEEEDQFLLQFRRMMEDVDEVDDQFSAYSHPIAMSLIGQWCKDHDCEMVCDTEDDSV